MKGLLRYLSPLAPDQSGAVAVLYGMECITVICDAGGCTGNICGFDEPRWQGKPGAVFSAGLRDMDAILGRDDQLIEKLADAAGRLDVSFSAIIGTPVPAVIGTDYRALARMAEKKCGMPALAIECTGTRLYDEGASDTYLALFRTFPADEDRNSDGEKGRSAGTLPSGEAGPGVSSPEGKKRLLGILGMTPLDISLTDGLAFLEKNGIYKDYSGILAYGAGSGLEDVKKASDAVENILVSPSGLKAARYLKKKYGTPYRWDYPFISGKLQKELEGMTGRRVLVVHQQAAASRARDIIEEAAGRTGDADRTEVVCAGWFLESEELRRPGDLHLETEGQFAEVCSEGGFDAIIADPEFLRAARMLGYQGELVEFPHFAVSGVMADE